MTRTLTVSSVFLATLMVSTTAHAGFSARQDGDRVELDCDGACYVLVQNVGSRIHIFDLSAQKSTLDSRRSYCDSRPSYGTLPRRSYTYAQSEIAIVDVQGSGSDNYIDLGGTGPAPTWSAVVDLGSGQDYLISEVWVDADLGDNEDCAHLNDGGVASGGRGSDVLYGWNVDRMSGNRGDDELWGRCSEDCSLELDGGDGDDTIDVTVEGYHSVVRNCLLKGGNNEDYIRAVGCTTADIYGQSGSDYIWGSSNDDYIEGGDGGDEIHGRAGDDEIHGGEGADEIYGGADDDVIHGNRGNDYVRGGPSSEYATTESGEVVPWGTDYVFGDKDDDRLSAKGERSAVIGGGGSDTCTVWDSGAAAHQCETVR